MKCARVLSLLTVTLTLTVLPLGGCGSGGGPGETGETGIGPKDAGGAAEDLVKAPDLVVAKVPGEQLAAGTFAVVGVTSDDQVIAYDTDTGAVVAVPLAGGTKKEVSPLPDSVEIDGQVVFIGETLDARSGVGPLWVWSAGSGARMLDKSSLVVASASEDGAWLAWSGNAAADGSTTDIFVGKGDGSGAVKVFAGALNDACYPDFAFHGATLLVSHCEKGGVGATLHVVDPATGQATLLADKLRPSYSADKTGAAALVITMDGMGQVVSVPGAQLTAIAAMDDGVLLPDGSAVVYLDGTTAWRFALPGDVPVKLAAGVSQLYNAAGTGYDLSPDGKWLIVPDNIDDDTGTSDLQLLSTQVAQAPLPLVGDATGAIFGDPFTRDSGTALYFSNATNNYGPLHAQPTTGGRALSLGGGRGWYAYAASGRKIVWNDNYVAGKDEGPGTADILVADGSQAGPGRLIVARADEDFALSHAGDKVVFSSGVAGKAGLYAVAVP